MARWPLAIETSLVHNFGATDQQRAAEVLAKVGKTQHHGDWHFSYSFERVERDAVVGAFTSDDWWFHSDHRGSRVSAAFTFLPHTFFQFGAVFQKRHGTPTLVKRLQVDVAARF
ncbi:MAG: putative porin [Acidobacteria bacterium]|nr:putative porin [Acidobacteriota bacterium]MCI0723328.1 putative porin [Acidobacteriota bacterium]